MNILFCTFYDVSPTKGGTERITTTISKGLSKKGHRCYLLYFKDIESDSIRTRFEKRIKIDKMNAASRINVKRFLIENNIDTILIQGLFETTSWLRKIIAVIKGKKISLIFAHHFNPGGEEKFLTFRKTIRELKKNNGNKLKNLAKTVFYPLAKIKYHHKLHYQYKQTYLKADKVVLLSKSFIPSYVHYANLTSTDKFHIIHNALSFDTFYDMNQYDAKEKKVLIVSRLEEKQKRIKLAINIWEKIEKNPLLKSWKLIILGSGTDEKKYKKLVKAKNLRQIQFEGKQEPESYYHKSSIFVMTSRFEGWGLTLTEAQQYGVVPIAFDSYTSLHDIIQDSINGFIIPEGNVTEYINKLTYLMENNAIRKNIANKCIESSKRFSQETIVQEWIKLLTKINQ